MPSRTEWALLLCILLLGLVVWEDNAPTSRSVLGPIPVVENDSLLDAEGALGAYDPNQRVIFVRSSLRGTWRQAVINHEVCHAALQDRDIQIQPQAAEEAVCDAVGYAFASPR